MSTINSAINNWVDRQTQPITSKVLANKGIFHSRLYIAYNEKDKEWSLVELNIFFRLARKIFGCYKDTHLNLVKKELKKLEFSKEYKALQEKNRPVINEIFEKILKKPVDPKIAIQAQVNDAICPFAQLDQDSFKHIFSYLDTGSPHIKMICKKAYATANFLESENRLSISSEEIKQQQQRFLQEAISQKDFININRFLNISLKREALNQKYYYYIDDSMIENDQKQAFMTTDHFYQIFDLILDEKGENQNAQKTLELLSKHEEVINKLPDSVEKLSNLVTKAIELDKFEVLEFLINVLNSKLRNRFNLNWIDRLIIKNQFKLALDIAYLNTPSVYPLACSLFDYKRIELFREFLNPEPVIASLDCKIQLIYEIGIKTNNHSMLSKLKEEVFTSVYKELSEKCELDAIEKANI